MICFLYAPLQIIESDRYTVMFLLYKNISHMATCRSIQAAIDSIAKSYSRLSVPFTIPSHSAFPGLVLFTKESRATVGTGALVLYMVISEVSSVIL